MLKTKQINDIVVKPVFKQKQDYEDNSRVLGGDIFSIYARIFLCASSLSGKTTTLLEILKRKADKRTKLVVFCATHNNDNSWDVIKSEMELLGIQAEYHSSIFDEETKENLVQIYMKALQEKAKKDKDKKKEIKHAQEINNNKSDRQLMLEKLEKEKHEIELRKQALIKGVSLQEFIKSTEPEIFEKKVKKERKPKKLSPEYIFVFDDIANELSNPYINKLLKNSRHFKSSVILSSQNCHDITRQAMVNLQYILLFKGFPMDKLELIYDRMCITTPFDEFVQMYKLATQEKYNFFYISFVDGSFRKNFNTEIYKE